MKQHPPRPITLSAETIAKCDAPNQFEKFDRMFRTVIAVPKTEIDRREAKWKRKRDKERAKNSR